MLLLHDHPFFSLRSAVFKDAAINILTLQLFQMWRSEIIAPKVYAIFFLYLNVISFPNFVDQNSA